MTEQATRYVAAPLEQVWEILLQPLDLPAWNEAFKAISGPAEAAIGVSYPLTVRQGLSGHWRYTAIEANRIEAVWDLPGFHEDWEWTLQRQGAGTLVTHTFRHKGVLAALLSNAYKGIAEVRLGRLSKRLLGQ
jgi:uncharacterized protein YndB with AHSA1/START domain